MIIIFKTKDDAKFEFRIYRYCNTNPKREWQIRTE